MSFDRESRKRIGRQTRRSEQEQTPFYRPKNRRQKPMRPASTSELVWAKHSEEIPRAIFREDEDEIRFTAVEVEAYELVAVPEEGEDEEDIELGRPGKYKLRALLDADDQPKKYVVMNPSFTDAIPKDEWFAFLPTSAKIQSAAVWSC